ncbi:MAG: YebC/PmpR family DNA-binding transcriptional regulator [Dehalogenimonas sp.]|jgi:YebC/PmpR family DNA-binding regulatory protein|uniref:Probable transcriptional regulatory protein V8247_05685 n=1 Tax=Candidatus Dehalogenimonas loeffleri TaxID=3127115 RepID=A0ABZ2J1J3_9CHLR|nr:YebC/PmpR family DNA-binding transcriptional regulator [Dehalogenimonas sp.]
MSGHSKWATIKHQKGAADAKRGQLFTKLSREIILASKEGGPDPDMNARLRLAVQKAKDARMPSDNIDRAIKKGSGQLEGETLLELTLEGYGPGGVAVLVHAVSDNRNRAIQEVRHLFTKSGGAMGEAGCVAWIFDSKGTITVPAAGQDIDELTLEVIDAGAEDVKPDEEYLEIITAPDQLEAVRQAIEAKGLTIENSGLDMQPKTQIELDDDTAMQVLKLLTAMEELDDVQNVYSNADFSPEALEKFQAA